MVQAQILSTTELGHCHTHNAPVSIQKCNDTLALIRQTCDHFKKRSTVYVALRGLIYKGHRLHCFLRLDVNAEQQATITIESHVHEQFKHAWKNRHSKMDADVYCLYYWKAILKSLKQKA